MITFFYFLIGMVIFVIELYCLVEYKPNLPFENGSLINLFFICLLPLILTKIVSLFVDLIIAEKDDNCSHRDSGLVKKNEESGFNGEYLKMRWIILILSIVLLYVWKGAPEDTKKEIIESLSNIQYEFTKLDDRIISNKLGSIVNKFDGKENNEDAQDIVNVKLSDITILKRLDVQSKIDSLEIYSMLINRGNCEVYLPENAAKEISNDFNLLPEKLSEYNKIGYNIFIKYITDGMPIKNYGQPIKYGEIMQFITKENCEILSIDLNTSSGNFVINKNRIEVSIRNVERNKQKPNASNNISEDVNPSGNTDQSDNTDQSE